MRFVIENYRKCMKESVKVATFSIKFPDWFGLTIKDMNYFVKGNNRWISFPQKMFEVDGEKKYFSFVSFERFDTMKQLQKEVLAELDKENRSIESSVTPSVAPSVKKLDAFEDQIPF